jgi:hypothetical protein
MMIIRYNINDIVKELPIIRNIIRKITIIFNELLIIAAKISNL